VRSFLLVLAALTLPLTACGERGGPADDDGAPTPEERLADWEAQPEGTSVPVGIGFGRALPDSAIAAVLTRYSVRPYAVYLVAAGTESALVRERSRASLEVLGEAREQAVAQLRTSLCGQPGRIRAMLEQSGGPDQEGARQALGYVLALQRIIPELEAGVPTIYGVEAVGTVDDVRALRSAPEVVSWEPGSRESVDGVDTVVVIAPQPASAAQAEPALDSSVRALGFDEVRTRLVALTENGAGPCEDTTPSDEPR
jgi:hypothetical protein